MYMAGELERVAQQVFGALDRGDAEAVIRLGAEEMQGVDELSRRWLRGIDEVSGYIRQLTGMVKDVQSTLGDVHETVWGDTGAVSCWLEQDYTLDEIPQHVSAPTTLLFRREADDWKVALFHSVPLPPESA
jgi:ketosteroid isomerase-like protein